MVEHCSCNINHGECTKYWLALWQDELGELSWVFTSAAAVQNRWVILLSSQSEDYFKSLSYSTYNIARGHGVFGSSDGGLPLVDVTRPCHYGIALPRCDMLVM